jgi:transposase-like protein
VQLTGPGGLLTGVTKMVLETELAEHLGYERGDPAGRGSPNTRNGRTEKTVHTDAGPVRITVPRDRAGSRPALSNTRSSPACGSQQAATRSDTRRRQRTYGRFVMNS